jgi:hypothetical protein
VVLPVGRPTYGLDGGIHSGAVDLSRLTSRPTYLPLRVTPYPPPTPLFTYFI